ncbi:MAG: T9SS type A sorting domain-containing protein, partial [Bacteroidota bacterium]
VVCNNDTANPDAAGYMGGDDMGVLTITAVMISFNDCQTIRMAMDMGAVSATLNAPAAGTGCNASISLPGPGTYTASPITGNGSVIGGSGAAWYTYTPAADGVVTVNSCGGGVNTNLSILSAECPLPDFLIAQSADDCDDGGGNMVASTVDFLGLENTTYVIHWDDAESADGFDFDVALGPLPMISVTLTVDMSFETVASDGVFIIGSFNSFTPEAMSDNGDGTWSYTTMATSLDELQWKYQNGMGNTEDGAALEGCGIDDGMGSFNRVVSLTTISDVVLASTCFGSCADCVPTDCNDPIELQEDDFESYDVGTAPADNSDVWAPWPGGAPSLASDEQALSGTVSMKIDGTSGTEDNLQLLGDRTSGHFKLDFNYFIGEGNGAYFNIQKLQDQAGTTYAMQCDMRPDGTLSLDAGVAGVVERPYRQGGWINIVMYLDLDNDWARLFIDGDFIYGWPISWETFVNTPGLIQLGSVNHFPIDANYIFYVDDVTFAALPAAGAGQYCYTATEAMEGTNTVTGPIECFGGAHNVFDINDGILNNGEGAVWYTYTPAEDGWIDVSTCEGGADTRAWIFDGDCSTLAPMVVSDDRCAVVAGGDAFASQAQAVVTGGTTYRIMFDNQWDNNGFDWNLTFNSGAAPAGDFCSSAIAVTAGETVTVGTIDGKAQVTGPAIGVFAPVATANPTPYVQSEWYSFTPDNDGLMTLSTCDLSAEDTRVFVYTGTCDNYSTLTLIAVSDDDCGAGGNQALISDFNVSGGTTYYIEFDDAFTAGNFDFTIDLFQTRDVVFTVDMEKETVASDGVFIAGSFTGWDQVSMNNDLDGTWSFTTTARIGDTLQYKFLNGMDGWEGSENLADCGVEDGFGGFNREFVVGDTGDPTTDVCFSHCVICDEVITPFVNETDFINGLRMFPNPATDVAEINYNFSEALDLTIRVTNSMGQLLFQKQLEGAQNGTQQLDLSTYAPGVYFVVMTDGVNQHAQRLVVQK